MKQQGFTRQTIVDAELRAAADQIQTQTNALLVLSSTGGTATATGQEQTLYIDDEPLGCWEPLALYVDLDNMEALDTTVIRVYHRLNDPGSLQLWSYNTYTGADGGLANGLEVVKIDLGPNRHGFRVTLDQSAGTNRDYDWELFARI